MLESRHARRFSGGIPLRPYKALSTSLPIGRPPLAATLVVAMRQHPGPPCRPLVARGERVACGQPVGAAESGAAAAVHAPAAGHVIAIEDRAVPSGSGLVVSPCVVIETEHADRGTQSDLSPQWPSAVTDRLAAIRDAGIVGLGGAAFPTAAKLGSGRACHTLILNGAECEPYISCDDVLMREHPDSVLDGAVLMLGLLGADRCLIAIERDKIAALDAMKRELGARNNPRLILAPLPTVYPAGGERQLVESLLGQEVPAGRFPIELGVVCQNVGTAHALARFVATGRPLVSRIVTMTGHGLREPQNVEAPIGTPIRHLIEHCGGLLPETRQLILGGNMMGYALPGDDIPVTKSTNCVIALPADEVWIAGTEWPCIRCGACADVCPARLLPQDLLRAARRPRFEALQRFGLADCIECGCCDVVCPSHIPLTAVLTNAKHDFETHLDRVRRGEAADRRHARRVERVEHDAAEGRREQTQLKAALGADQASRQAAIEAAIARARRRRDSGDEGH
jgi:electron transport complex protein RnfC